MTERVGTLGVALQKGDVWAVIGWGGSHDAVPRLGVIHLAERHIVGVVSLGVSGKLLLEKPKAQSPTESSSNWL